MNDVPWCSTLVLELRAGLRQGEVARIRDTLGMQHLERAVRTRLIDPSPKISNILLEYGRKSSI